MVLDEKSCICKYKNVNYMTLPFLRVYLVLIVDTLRSEFDSRELIEL